MIICPGLSGSHQRAGGPGLLLQDHSQGKYQITFAKYLNFNLTTAHGPGYPELVSYLLAFWGAACGSELGYLP